MCTVVVSGVCISRQNDETNRLIVRLLCCQLISLPVILTSQTSQEIMARGTLIWDAAFSSQVTSPSDCFELLMLSANQWRNILTGGPWTNYIKGPTPHFEFTEEFIIIKCMISTIKTGSLRHPPCLPDKLVLLLLVCVSFTIIGQPRNSVLIRRV